MADHSWALPGPAAFVHRVAEAFRDGRNVCVRFPRHAPEGFPAALIAEYNREPFFEFSPVRCDFAGGRRPIDQLFEQFAPERKSSELRDPQSLTTQPQFCGRLIFLEEIAAADWTSWRQFLADYAPVCRNVDRLQRTLFFASLDGGVAASPPPEDVCQAVFSWSDALDEIDITLFAARSLTGKSLSTLERRLLSSILAELAMWDTETCARLAAQPLTALLAPLPSLRAIATERGWTPTAPTESRWELGIEDSFGGRRRAHSAFLALCGDEVEIDRRLWRAQLRVLFPALEELRLALLPRFAGYLRVPVQTPSGTVSEVEDLEIGQIAHQLHSVRGLDHKTRDLVILLKDMRHALAHLEPVRDAGRLRRFFEAVGRVCE